MNNTLIPWNGKEGIVFPPNINQPHEIMEYATVLTPKQQMQVVSAFEIQAYDMAAEYTWKKAITKLKETIETLGPKFIGEMIGDDSLDEYSSIDEVLTDYATINLAEQLGVINKTAALKLKQSNELITHYFSKNADEDIDNLTALMIVKSSVQYILAEDNISIALEFSKFRDRLLNEVLKNDDSEVIQLIQSPLFYLKTVLAILLSALKNQKGAQLENAGTNLNMILPEIWNDLSEPDKWNVGTAYKDVTADGNNIAVSAIKSVLLKVKGFDYVPENLRSSTFKTVAKEVINTHFAMNNFYNEPKVVKKLINLGTSIPIPAFAECFQAYLAVSMGNSYGVSFEAARLAKEQLANTPQEKWLYYLNKILPSDTIILEKMKIHDPMRNFKTILSDQSWLEKADLDGKVVPLYNALMRNSLTSVQKEVQKLLDQIK